MSHPANPELQKKLNMLSPGLRKKIVFDHELEIPKLKGNVSRHISKFFLHCNAGSLKRAGGALKAHCAKRGKIFLSMSGAGSSFQMGKIIGKLIRAGKIAGISVTGANLEESIYRLVAHSCYVYIPDYEQLTPEQEKELDHAGLRRITDTFLPEDESVRIILESLEMLWREAEEQGKSYLWHEYFFMLFERDLIHIDPQADLDDCWVYQCWKHKIPIFVPGWEDSTMGNIFTWMTYDGKYGPLAKYKLEGGSIDDRVVKSNVRYMHALAEFYMKFTSRNRTLAFLQLGGGIAADFSICVVPHLKKDFFGLLPIEVQEQLVAAWAGFVEISSAPMDQGSYTGAGGKEKITWSKLEIDSFRFRINCDYTITFPLIAAIILGL